MDLKQISKLLIKIAGMVIIISAVTAQPVNIYAYYYSGSYTFNSFVGGIVLPFMVPLVIGMLMWIYSDVITNKVIDKNIDQEVLNKNISKLESLAISILGLILLFFALSDLTYNLAYVYASNVSTIGVETSSSLNAEIWGHIVGTIIELVFALFLLIKAKSVGAMFRS